MNYPLVTNKQKREQFLKTNPNISEIEMDELIQKYNSYQEKELLDFWRKETMDLSAKIKAVYYGPDFTIFVAKEWVMNKSFSINLSKLFGGL